MVTRTADRGTEVTATWGVPTFRRAAELLAEAPDFVIASTPWAVTPDTTRGEGPEPYPLAEGLQDHLISVAIGESLATGRDVTTTTEAWAR